MLKRNSYKRERIAVLIGAILFTLIVIFVNQAQGAHQILDTGSGPAAITTMNKKPVTADIASTNSDRLPTTTTAENIFKTAPVDLPSFTVSKWVGETGEGFIFLAYYNYWRLTPSAYLMILEDTGEPVYYQQLAPIGIAMDFKKQSNGLLTYYPLTGDNKFLGMDNSYHIVQTYEAGNGYTADFHDLQILENGNTLLLIHDTRKVDMSQVVEGGDPEAEVIGCTIQEIDSEKKVVFEWQSWGNIPYTDSNVSLTDSTINYMNCNSVELDDDGNILLSSRNLDEVTKINRQSGEIIWRLSWKQSGDRGFKFTNDMGFNYAHDARRLKNGNISVFDNGVGHSPPLARGVEYAVDVETRTVTRIQEYRTEPDVYSRALGNMQQLPNGNMLIGWGRSIDVPVFTEFDSSGQRILEFRSKPGHGSYRVFRFPWQGYPDWPPVLVAEAEDQTVTLYFSWNGSTETASYKIYRGSSRDDLSLLTTVARTGFETTYKFNASEQALWYFQVLPVDSSGETGQASEVVPLAVGVDPVYFPMIVSITSS